MMEVLIEKICIVVYTWYLFMEPENSSFQLHVLMLEENVIFNKNGSMQIFPDMEILFFCIPHLLPIAFNFREFLLLL